MDTPLFFSNFRFGGIIRAEYFSTKQLATFACDPIDLLFEIIRLLYEPSQMRECNYSGQDAAIAFPFPW